MATALRPIGHDDRLSVVDHLDELRTRIIISVLAFLLAFGVCFWQNHRLLHLLNQPLVDSTPTLAQHAGNGRLAQVAAGQAEERNALLQQLRGVRALAASRTQSPSDRAAYRQLQKGLQAQIAALPKTIPKRLPVTTGVGEPFTVTLKVAAWFGLLFALPIILYEAYAFILPAFNREEKQVALPLMLLSPFLFIAGVVFAFFMVLPPAINFLQNFNDQSFDVLIQAKGYYDFEILVLLALGLVFQLPVGLLLLQRIGVLSADTLIRQWRYAIVLIAVLAAALPGVDPVTTTLEMIPLILLYLLSILLLRLAERRSARRAALEPDHSLDDLDDFSD